MTRILVVEDSRTQAEKLRLILEAEGFEAEVANDGEQALTLLERDRFDLVVSDIVMPGIDGYELCRRIKLGPDAKPLPVILLTTLNDPMDIIQGLESGADNFITKPYEPEYLVARVRDFVRSQSLRQTQKFKFDVDLVFLGRKFTISSHKEQILDLLIATFEDIVRTNQELQQSRADLATANEKLEEHARRLEGQAYASEEKYRRLFETAEDAIVIADADTGVVIDASPSTARLTGRPLNTLLGTQLGQLLSDGEAEGLGVPLPALARTGTGRARETTVRRADGTAVPVEVSASVFELHGKRLFQGTFRDVTERKRLEEQLRRAQRMEAVGQLTGGIAHDFNNLLTVIIGNLDLVHERLDHDPGLAELTEAALNSAARGGELVQRLLAFSRKQTLEPRAIDLNERLPDIAAMLRRALGEAITVDATPGDRLWPALADPSQVEDALVNLAINARDAMARGGRLTIETANARLDEHYAARHAEVRPGDYVLLAVSDTGTGMPPEVVDRAFEPFFTTKGAGRGSGLGLSQVYGFVKQSGGHVKIYSETGHGTTVKIYLPRAETADAAAERTAGPGEATPTGAETILVVEDDAEVRRVAVQQLGQLGYTVREATSAREALAMLERGEAVDLLFTDIVMAGGMTGYDLAREANRRWPDLKVLLTSGYTEVAARNGNVGARGNLLSKPYRKQDLARKLRAVLDGEA